MNNDKKIKSGVFRDRDGKISSKRVAGFILLAVGVTVHIITATISYFQVIADPDTAIAVGNTLIYTGAALLGVGIAEHLVRGE